MAQILLGLSVLILFTLFGTLAWATSEIPLALREIALNTRRDKGEGPTYLFLRVMSVVIKIFAVILWVCGLLLSFYLVANFKELLPFIKLR
jgi:hypothetical protein